MKFVRINQRQKTPYYLIEVREIDNEPLCAQNYASKSVLTSQVD